MRLSMGILSEPRRTQTRHSAVTAARSSLTSKVVRQSGEGFPSLIFSVLTLLSPNLDLCDLVQRMGAFTQRGGYGAAKDR